MRPDFTLNFGARWEVNFPWSPLNKSYAWATPEQVWGPSGVNSLFKPGSTGGVASQVTAYVPGSPAYNTYWKAVNPSLGFAWSPHAKGFLGKILGGGTATVMRGGFSISYNNYDMGTYDTFFFGNPGGNVSISRSQNLGNLIVPGVSYPILFRDRVTNPHMLDPAPYAQSPAYPLQVGLANNIFAFDPNIRAPYTMSWTFGIQREISKDMAIEVRYAATRTKQNWYYSNLNETVLVENGWIDEFRKAQGNLYANIAAGKGRTFRYDSTVPGTQPLPIMLAYLSPNKLDPNVSNNYTAAALTANGINQATVFTTTSYVNYLNKYAPNAGSMASVFYNDSTRRGYALGNGLQRNLFMVNPEVGGAYIYMNGGGNQYDSMVVELRRRLAKGLLVQANYTWAKAFNINRLSYRAPWAKDLGATLPQALKINWVYELPLGQGKTLFASAGRLTDRLIGGWEVEGTSRIQSGNLWDLGNVNLIGMTDQDLRNSIGMYYDDANKKIWYFPKDIRDNSYFAYQYDAGGFTTSAPTGRYIAPAGTGSGGNCIQIVAGDCSPRHHYIRGPSFMRFDISLVKRIRFSESKNFELRGEFLNAFNNINFNDVYSLTGSSTRFGDIYSAYSDSSNSQDPGGRMVQIVMRINF